MTENCAIFPAETALELYHQMKKKEYNATRKFRGDLQISPDLKIEVQTFTKSRQESLPGLKKYSKACPESNRADVGEIVTETTFAEVDDPEQKEVATDQIKKAFKYGKQLVPVDEENQLKLNGKEEKKVDEKDISMADKNQRQFKMLGFTARSKVPRAHFIAGVDVVLPQKGDANERAFAAMVHAMIETDKVMIAKIVERANAQPKLVSLYPHVEDGQPLLYLATLPTAEDLREYSFPPLVKAN